MFPGVSLEGSEGYLSVRFGDNIIEYIPSEKLALNLVYSILVECHLDDSSETVKLLLGINGYL